MSPLAYPGTDTGHEFLEVERLDDVVVGAALQRCDGVGGGTPGRQDDDRDAHLATAQCRQDSVTVQAGEPDVEEQEIEFAAGGVVHGRDAVGNHGGRVAGRAQSLFDETGNAFFVFCDEDADQGGSLEGRDPDGPRGPRVGAGIMRRTPGLPQYCGVSCTRAGRDSGAAAASICPERGLGPGPWLGPAVWLARVPVRAARRAERDRGSLLRRDGRFVIHKERTSGAPPEDSPTLWGSIGRLRLFPLLHRAPVMERAPL